jgi:hypothetical protein
MKSAATASVLGLLVVVTQSLAMAQTNTFPPSGNVGIGTLNPQTLLDISGGALRIANQGDGAVLLTLRSERPWEFRQLRTGAATALELASASTGSKHFIINTPGRVGIGTTNPGAKLDIAGTTRTRVLEITGGSDVAESFDIVATRTIRPGMVVVIDSANPGWLRMSDRAYDRAVAGIVSGANGLATGLLMAENHRTGNGAVSVALTGRVYCLVDAVNGPIRPGDLLTTSNIPGHAMKATDRHRAEGAIIGKAMTALKSGRGFVLVLVTLQ